MLNCDFTITSGLFVGIILMTHVHLCLINYVTSLGLPDSPQNASEPRQQLQPPQDLCANSCRYYFSLEDYLSASCQCVHVSDGAQGCLLGCQTVRCRCGSPLTKICDMWCAGHSLMHGCDCSNTWLLQPLQPATVPVTKFATTQVTVQTTTRPTITCRTPEECGGCEDPYMGRCRYSDFGASPAMIGSIVAALVIVVIVLVLVTTYSQRRRLDCWKRRHSRAGRGIPSFDVNHSTSAEMRFVASRSLLRMGVPPQFPPRAPRGMNPPPTPSAPPSYEESVQLSNLSHDTNTARSERSPPPYTETAEDDTSPAGHVNTSTL